ncbi:MAG: TIM barrel protein, partial [Candidatus Firestonebacteria bacterium]
MKIGFLTAYNSERIAFAEKNGFSSVELLVAANRNDKFYPGQKDWKRYAAEIRNEFENSGVYITSVGGFYLNVLDEKKQAAMTAEVKNTVLLARELGSKVACGFSGRVMGEELEKSLPRYKKIWTPLAKFASENGIKIGFEHCPMGRNHLPPGGNNAMC